MPLSRDPLLEDPLWQEYSQLGARLLGEEPPEMEAARKERGLGILKQDVAGQYARAGYTGSSSELDALQRSANRFELDWAEREPAKKIAALTAANLPIRNLAQMLNREAMYGGTYAGAPTQAAREYAYSAQQGQEEQARIRREQNLKLISGVAASLGIPQWLASELFGIGGAGIPRSSIPGLLEAGDLLTSANLAEEWAALGGLL